MSRKSCTLIIGINSGIGEALASHLKLLNERVIGTSRCTSLSEENNGGIFHLDVSSPNSISTFVEQFSAEYTWERLVFCPAVMTPIGPFKDIDIEEWIINYNINFTSQAYLLHKLLPVSQGVMPRVLFFAGGGTNSAPKYYSAYILSKIALIKLVELLNEEMDDLCFSIIGPGWVNTRIHAQSIALGLEELESYKETSRRIQECDFVPMEKVVDSIMWVLSQSKEIVGGRNFSTAHDPYDSDELIRLISSDHNVFKLRRYGNSLSNRSQFQ